MLPTSVSLSVPVPVHRAVPAQLRGDLHGPVRVVLRPVRPVLRPLRAVHRPLLRSVQRSVRLRTGRSGVLRPTL